MMFYGATERTALAKNIIKKINGYWQTSVRWPIHTLKNKSKF